MLITEAGAFAYEKGEEWASEAIYRYSIQTWQYSIMNTSQYDYLEPLLWEIHEKFGEWNSDNWAFEVPENLQGQEWGFDLYWLIDLLDYYKKINKSLLYQCIVNTLEKLHKNHYSKYFSILPRNYIFYGDYDNFGFYGYFPWPKWTDNIAKSLALTYKPETEDFLATVSDEVHTIVNFIDEIVLQKTWQRLLDEQWKYVHETVRVYSCLISSTIRMTWYKPQEEESIQF